MKMTPVSAIGRLKWLVLSLLVLSATTLPLLAPAQTTADQKTVVQHAQTRLHALGYDPGAPDGTMGPKSAAALTNFQADHGLSVTGTLDSKTLAALNAKQSSGDQPASTRPAATKHAATLVIRKAIYGDLDSGTTVDVADKVRAMVKNGALSVTATDDTFGDPYTGKMKLTITRAEVRVPNINLGGEGGAGDFTDKVKLFQNGNSLHMKITGTMKITVYYDYGDGKQRTAHSERDGSVDITVPTKLRVDYTANGVEAGKTVDLGQTLKINANDPIAASPPPVNVAGTLWASTDSNGDFDDYHFQADGTVSCKSSAGSDEGSGTWKQDGASILFELNHYARYQGTISGNRMEGSASNNAGKNWTWSAEKK